MSSNLHYCYLYADEPVLYIPLKPISRTESKYDLNSDLASCVEIRNLC